MVPGADVERGGGEGGTGRCYNGVRRHWRYARKDMEMGGLVADVSYEGLK